MKKLILFALMFAASIFGQAVRFDTNTYTTNGGCVSGKQCPVLAIPGATVAVCTPPNCAAKATTYTNAGAGTACATNAQLTPSTGGACTPYSDAQGNAGFWILPGTYNYYITLPNGGATYGPYPISIQGAAGGYVLDSLYTTLANACTAAGSGTLAITKVWTGTPTQTLTCKLLFLGDGRIQPASGQTITLPANTGCPLDQQCYDISLGGTIAFSSPPSNPVSFVQWGADRAGVTDSHTAMQAALTAISGAGALSCDGTYKAGATTITVPNAVRVFGPANQTCNITYSGTGVAVDARSSSNYVLENLKVITSNGAATAWAFGNGSLHATMTNVFAEGVNGAGNTGTGLLFDGTSSGFSAHVVGSGMYALQYKYPVRFLSDGSGHVWTSVTFNQLWAVCANVANVGIAGSIGFYMDGNSAAGVGSTWSGGTIESCAKSFQFDDGAKGFGSMIIDEEANTNPGTFGKNVNTQYFNINSGDTYSQSWNGSSNFWYKTQTYLGNVYRYTRYNILDTISDDAGSSQTWGVQRGISEIDGGTPSPKWVVHADTSSDSSVERNYVTYWGGKHVSYGSAAPASGTWLVGDLVFNNAGSGYDYWVCTVAGTPGTWLAHGTTGIYLTGQTGALVNTSVVQNTDSVVHQYLITPVMRVTSTNAAGNNTINLRGSYTRLAGAYTTMVLAMQATIINDSFDLNNAGTATPSMAILLQPGETFVVNTTIGGAGTTYTYDLSVRAQLMQ